MLKVFEYSAIIAASIFAVALIGLVVLYSSQPPHEPQQQSAHELLTGQQQRGHPESFWRRTMEDPIALYTLVLAIFTGLLALIAVLQIRLMNQAEYTSTQAANAAQKSAEIAERALIAGQRAFVAFSSVTTAAVVDHKTSQVIQWSLTPIWKNAGTTPTRNMTNHISLMAFAGELPKDWDFPDISSTSLSIEPVPLGISPQNIINGEAVSVSCELMDEVILRKKVLYMWGWAAYSDVFPNTERHITRFAIQIQMGGNPRDPQQISFNTPFHAKYNCSDEECATQGYPVSWKPRSVLVGALPSAE